MQKTKYVKQPVAVNVTIGEHLRDLRSESRDDCGVKEGVKSCQKNTSDNHANDDLDAGINVALTLLGFEYGLCGDCNRVDFVFDSVDELFHLCFTFLFVI